MHQQKQQHIEFFEQLTDDALPECFNEFDVQEAAQLRQYVEQVLDKERAGLDSLFESMSQTFKYIPNFILHAITLRYISPQVAARITVKLVLKQALSVAGGLPPEFIGETAVYLESDYAAIFLKGLPRKKAAGTIDYMMREHPLRLLDVLAYADAEMLDFVKQSKGAMVLDVSAMSKPRLSVLNKIK